MVGENLLASWRDTPARRAIMEFVRRVTAEGTSEWLGGAMVKHYHGDDGDRDFMRPFAEQLYGIPPERVIGSAFGLDLRVGEAGTDLLYKSKIDFFDDGPEKPVRIWSRTGRRPLVAAGNSNGDIPMLRFARRPGRDALRLLILHDDGDRKFDYVAGAEDALQRAREQAWTVVSVKDDWTAVFSQ